jgi:flagellar P-ring protein precursor FlgI
VTANMLPYAKNGDNLDITVASVGDARSLEGGQLILTQLRAPDNNVYGLAQGAISVGGINQSGGALSGGSTKNHILAGRIANGATLVRDMPAYASEDSGALTITLNEPDATTASRTAEAIRTRGFNAEAVSPSTVRIEIPPSFSGNRVDMIAQVEQLALRPDRVAKVIINERTGTVVMGGDVRLGPVALAHGSLRLLIARPGQSNGNGGTGGTGGYGARSSLYTGGFGPSGAQGVGTGSASSGFKAQSVMSLSAGTTLRDVTDALNTIGVTPRDLIAIIQALKQAGALDAVLEMQ